MKYDSSMTHLHDIVMANLRRMCSRDKAIIEQYCFHPGDATPAQLQDFLKSNCSSSGYNDKTQGIHFWCSRSKGVEITLDTPVNNDGDKTLTLSWSQVTKFIMNNWKEILGKSEPEKTVELNPINADISVLDLTIQSYNALKRMEINTVAELGTRTADIMKMLPKTYPRIFKAVEKYTGKPIASSANKSVRTYNEIFLEHFPDFDVSRFEEFVKEACVEYYFEVSPSCDHECKSHWKSECLSKWRDDIEDCDLEILKKYLVTNVGKKAPEPDKTYKDILLEHYPNFDMSKFNDFIASSCIKNFFDIGDWQCSYGVTSPADDDDFRECRKHWENKCLHEWRKENDKINLNDIEEYLIPKADETPAQENVPTNAEKYVFACDGCRYDRQGCCNYPETQNDYCVNGDKKICSDPPAQNDTAATVFDYSELDGDTAGKLREVSERVISIKARYIIETAKQVKIAHDLLAKCGNGMFGAWCVSVGFTRQTGDNYLKIVKLFDNLSDEQRENLAKLTEGNMNLLYAITKPSAPPELVEAVKNGDITNHKDFIAMKKQLEEANKRAENAEMLSLTYKQNYDQMNKNFQEACEDNTNLERRIKELESRPVDVAVQQDKDVQNELERLREENERLRDKNVKNFLLHMTIEEFEQLLDLTECSEYIHSIVSKADIIRL